MTLRRPKDLVCEVHLSVIIPDETSTAMITPPYVVLRMSDVAGLRKEMRTSQEPPWVPFPHNLFLR